MRRVVLVVVAISMTPAFALGPGVTAVAQVADCSSTPCDAPVTVGPGSVPVVVQGNPAGVDPQTDTGVFDRRSSATVPPAVVALIGLFAVMAALALALRHRRRDLDRDCSTPVVNLERAEDH